MFDKIMNVVGTIVLVLVGLVMLYDGITHLGRMMFG